MNYQDRKDYIVQVESEVIRACNKHDRVCDFFIDPHKSMSEIYDDLKAIRDSNDNKDILKCTTFSGIIAEELLEAYEAYSEGDLNNCIKELAQVCAVAIRGMDFVYKQTNEYKAKEKFKESV